MNNIDNYILKDHFSKYLEDNLQLGFFPGFIGREKCNPLKPKCQHLFSDQCALHFILSGKGYLTSDNGTIMLREKDVFYLPMNVGGVNNNTFYYPDVNDPWEYIWVHISGLNYKGVIDSMKISSTNNVYSIRNFDVVKKALVEMIEIAKETPKRNLSYYLPYLMTAFAEIIEERKYIEYIETKKEKTVKTAIDYIEKNYKDPNFSLEDLARKLFYAPSYISRIFKETIGKSPIEYVITLRMLTARDMLVSNRYSINEVSQAVGYNSQFYFSREFKKYYKISPLKYSKQQIITTK